jgi:probable rRNA maturation factor
MIEVEISDQAWTWALADAAAIAEFAADAAIVAALASTEASHEGDLVILLTDDAHVRDLNNRFRGKDAPTNVLSFAAPPNARDLLGDIALAYGVCAAEAEGQGKTLADHLRHLTIHGVLHLFGYDHEIDSEAEAMEALERRILAGLGVADPYAGENDHGSDRRLESPDHG